MRIATYNLWNSDAGMPLRKEQITDTLKSLHADILCLQEVYDRKFHDFIAEELGYSYHCFHAFSNEVEGLSVLSHFPIDEIQCLSRALCVKVQVLSLSVAIANVHLPWDSVLRREKEIISIHKAVSALSSDYRLLLGDFNTSDGSSVQQYLLGHASLCGEEALPCWFDIAEGYACRQNTIPEPTLNFCRNPRWKNASTVESNQRFDRILMQNPYPNKFPMLEYVGVFGKEISPESGFSPSDHYGVYADLFLV